MASIDEGLLEAAQKYLGYQEQGNGYTRFGDWYYANVDQSDPYFKTAPWCDMFITWAANQAGVEKYVGEFAYTVDHAKWFQAQGAWSDKPEPGAIVFYDWSGSKDVEGIDHAGIVERVDGERIATIEGNIDKVWLKRKDRDQSKVVGYGLPRKVREKAGGGREVVILEGELGSSPTQPAAFGKAGPPKAAVAAVAPASGGATLLVGTMAVPAGALVALLGTVLVIRRARKRQFARPSSAGGRHRRTGGGRQTLAT
ncbi:CHAP domain-containing protein [Nonomuraea sp. NPDC051941]|uniref:CHAP domain-containing protein n=1 Tax=Nonomuraea sp. NPDC051941 TaxID=3364373 RepID=UPI0037C85A08